jgi:hypothetical protein
MSSRHPLRPDFVMGTPLMWFAIPRSRKLPLRFMVGPPCRLSLLSSPSSTSRPRFNAWKEALERRASALRSLRAATSPSRGGVLGSSDEGTKGGTKGSSIFF